MYQVTIKLDKNNSFYFGKIWDENSKRIKLDDPSECVRSDEIIPILKNTFRDVDIRYYNGSILFYALYEKFSFFPSLSSSMLPEGRILYCTNSLCPILQVNQCFCEWI